jgi:hypothetical protein
MNHKPLFLLKEIAFGPPGRVGPESEKACVSMSAE